MQEQVVKQVVEALKKANNVLVTVKSSPSVDELTAAVGLTLILNHMKKHATTVFSGQVPSTIEFLQPEMAIETNTDSLRDFIISLDKSKADKLRYKVENDAVRIFITPYKTSISEDDLEFSQGDFNVDVVIALGVVSQQDFDQAVNTHGRILHDATIIGVTKKDIASQVGAINWHDPQASSISEMISSITELLGPNLLDGQIATSLMTGMVAETDRFRNTNTTPRVLSLSAKLMTAGANQQLIADKLEEGLKVPETQVLSEPGDPNPSAGSDGMLEIAHESDEEEIQDIQIDDHGNMQNMPSQQGLNLQTSDPQNSVSQQTSPPTENPVSEIPTHEYLSGLAPKAVADPPVSIDINRSPQKDELLGDQSTAQAEGLSNNPAGPSGNNSVIEHNHKVIEPLADVGADSDQPPVSMPSASTSTPGVPSVTPPELPGITATKGLAGTTPTSEQKKDSTASSAEPTADTQTLTDLETAVNNGDKTDTETSKVEDYSGSVRKPADKTTQHSALPPAPASEDKDPLVLEPIVVDPENKPSDPSKLPEPPKQNTPPTTAPAVPPPLMPPTTSQPQFFEADGSKGNPLLNPSGK